MVMVTKFCSLVSCLNGTLPIKSHEYLITKSCKITWKIKTVLSPLSQCFMLPPSSLWGYTTYQILYISACTRPMATKNGKVVTHSERLLPINSYKHVFTRGHVTNQKHYISTITMVMVSRLMRVMTYHENIPPIISHDLSIR